MLSLKRTPLKILDFDIENRPLSYLGMDFTTCEITAIAASFGPEKRMYCWLLGKHEPRRILEEFVRLYNKADMVTGHYIRKHDLPIINGALLEMNLPPLEPKLTCDTKIDLKVASGVSKSQESLCEMLGVPLPKEHMTQAQWRAANRLTTLTETRRRVTGDVRQHQLLRQKLTDLGMLRAPRMWSVR